MVTWVWVYVWLYGHGYMGIWVYGYRYEAGFVRFDNYLMKERTYTKASWFRRRKR